MYIIVTATLWTATETYRYNVLPFSFGAIIKKCKRASLSPVEFRPVNLLNGLQPSVSFKLNNGNVPCFMWFYSYEVKNLFHIALYNLQYIKQQ